MKNTRVLCLAFVGLILGSASVTRAQGGMPDLSDFGGAIEKKSQAVAQQKPKPGALFKTSLSVPSVKPGEAARGLIRGMRLKMEEQAKTDPAYNKPAFLNAFKELEAQMPQVLSALETEMGKQGFAKRDMGVAAGAVFTTLYETANNTKLSDQADKVAVKAMASVADTAWSPKWKTLAPAAKEKLYENLLTSTMFQALMAEQFAKAGKTEDETSIRTSAAQLFETLVGTPPSKVKIADDGTISGLDQPKTDEAPATDAPATDAPATGAPATGAPDAGDMAQ